MREVKRKKPKSRRKVRPFMNTAPEAADLTDEADEMVYPLQDWMC